MYTLPLGYVLPLNGRTRDLHPVDVRHAWRTKEKGDPRVRGSPKNRRVMSVGMQTAGLIHGQGFSCVKQFEVQVCLVVHLNDGRLVHQIA